MTIIKWDPYKSMKQIQKNIDDLFEPKMVKSKFSADEETKENDWEPPVDIYEEEKEIVIKSDLPEVDEKNINVKFEDSMLVLTGERKFSPETNVLNYLRIERPYGSFKRKFAVPSNVDINNIKAKLTGGILKIYLPKKAKTK